MRRSVPLIGGLILLALPLAAFADHREGEDCRDEYHSRYNQSYQSSYRPQFSPPLLRLPGNISYQDYGRYPFRPTYQYDPYQDSIRRGIATGQLSEREARELLKDNRDLRLEEARYWSDGRLSRDEQRDLWKDRREFEKDLNHELKDKERRDSRWWWW